MNTNILAVGVIDVQLGGLVVSVAARLKDNGAETAAHSYSSTQPPIPRRSTVDFSIGAHL